MSGQQQGNSLHDSGIGWVLILGVFAVLIWLFWIFFDVEIRNVIRWIRYAEMWVISIFVDNDFVVMFDGKEISHAAGVDRTPEYPKEKLTFKHLSLFNALAMQPLRVPFVILLGTAAVWCMFKGPNTQFRRRFDIEKLIEVQSKNFPAIAPFVHFNPSKQPPRPPGAPVPAELPLFAEALGPEEWLAYNQVNVGGGTIDRNSAARAFRKQLGRPWRGAKALPPEKQVLLAAFCLKASRKRDQADDLLGRLAFCWRGEKGLSFSKDKGLVREAVKVLRNKDLAGATLAQVNRHGYETTAMLRALQFARQEGGVLAPAQFVWLRAHDRSLWYPLNNLGRQAYHAEALGAMAHFKAERLTNRPIPVPKVEGAIETMIEYMNDHKKARPIPQLDYSGSKKSGIKKAV